MNARTSQISKNTIQPLLNSVEPNKALLSKITSVKTLKSLGILLMQASDLRSITANSGSLARSNEYQVHYWALVGRFSFSDEVYIDIAIPTVYFNYKQEVSGSSVDFELSAVDEMSEALLPIHNTKVNEILTNKSITAAIEKLSSKFQTEVGSSTFSWIGVSLNTIHRHP